MYFKIIKRFYSNDLHNYFSEFVWTRTDAKLPLSDFRWLNDSELESFDIQSIDLDGDDGFILECDLEYPESLHVPHHNLPLAPDYLEIDQDNLSDYAIRALKECDNKSTYKDSKLISHFHDRIKYGVHAKNLKLYLNLGMKLKKVHRILTFKQSNFIAPFIEKCTLARKNSKTKFAMDQYKKVANCVYGKTLQNVREYTKVQIHNTKNSAMSAVSKPTYKNFAIITPELVQTTHFYETIVHDKPTAIGFTILELSKLFMFDFYYNKMTKNQSFKIDLGMSDTDSFLFSVNNPKNFGIIWTNTWITVTIPKIIQNFQTKEKHNWDFQR